MEFIVGCDIKGYSTLNDFNQNLLTAHIAGCHIKSLAKSRLTPLAFNDTGDGFFVVFDDKSSKTDCKEYVKGLCYFYYSECNPNILKLSKTNWLKVAFGEGNVHITPQQGIRGRGINDIARILEVCRLQIPLELDNEIVQKETNLLYLKDKHDNKLYVKPLDLRIEEEIPSKHIPPCLRKANANQNPFYLLKKPSLPSKYGKKFIKEGWWDAFNSYIQFSDVIRKTYGYDKKKEDWEKYLSPIYISGLSNINIAERLTEMVGLTNKSKRKITGDPCKIRLIYLHPNSVDAKRLKSEDNISLRVKIIKSLRSLEDKVRKYSHLEKLIEIGFTNKPISIGLQKILDSMVVIYYSENHRSWDASYRFLNYFASEKEREEFCIYIDTYFEKLWNRCIDVKKDQTELNEIIEKRSGKDLKEFVGGIAK